MKKYIMLLLIAFCFSKLDAQNSLYLDIDSFEFIADLDINGSYSYKYESLNEPTDSDLNYYTLEMNHYTSDLNNQSKSSSSKSTNSEKDRFEDLANIKGIDVVYISKAMLSMMPNMNMPGVNVGNAVGKLESLQVFTAEQKNTINSLRTAIDKILKEGRYETLMQAKDDDSRTSFYSKQLGNGKSEILIITEESSELSIVRFIGTLSLNDLQNITK